VKGNMTNGVGSQYPHNASERGVSSINNPDVHTSAASMRLNDAPADLHGLVRFAERGKPVSARVPTRFKHLLITWNACTSQVGRSERISLYSLAAYLKHTHTHTHV
jgi:hypothetical protein